MEQSAFKKQLQELIRPINCLIDQANRKGRQQSLVSIKNAICTMQKHNLLIFLTQTKIVPHLLRTICDVVQKNRILSLGIVEKLIDICGDDGKNIYEQIIPVLIDRVAKTPAQEVSEDVRLIIFKIFIKLVPYKDCLLRNLSQLAVALAKGVADGYDQIKQVSYDVIGKLSTALPYDLGKYSTNIVIALRQNLKSAKFKVRKGALEAVSKILVIDGAGGNFEHIKTNLKASLSDKKKDVRTSAYDCVTHLLLFLSPKYMKEYQSHLISFLLMGLDDSEQDNVTYVISLLEKCGRKLREEEEGNGAMIAE